MELINPLALKNINMKYVYTGSEGDKHIKITMARNLKPIIFLL